VTDSLQSIKRSCLHFFSGTMLSRISGMFRDISLAFFFGTNETLAALFVAFRFTHLARRLFGEGALQSAFIPHFENIRKESDVRGCLFFRDLSFLWVIGLTVLTILGMFALHFVPTFLDLSPGTQEIFDLMSIMLPSIIPICLFGLNIAFLQCQKQYFTAGVAPIYFNLVIIAAAFLFRSYASKEGMPYLAGAIVVACFAQWFASFIPVVRYCKETLKNSLFSKISLFSKEIRCLFHPLALGLLGIGASQINNTIDVIFARAADPEGPAQLWFSIRFQQLPLALFGIALSSALLPPLSRAIQANDTEKYRSFLEFSMRQVLAFLLPCMTVLLVCGMPIINAIYGRGSFTAHSVITTTSCLQGYALALLPMGIITVLAPAFYAQKNYTTPLRGAILSLTSNIVLNSFLVFVLGWGAMSVTIATSISSWLNAIYLYSTLRKTIGPFICPQGWNLMKNTVVSTALASCITWIIILQFTSSPVFFSWGTSAYVPRAFFEQMLHLFLPMGSFCLSLFFFSWLVGAKDLFFFFKSKEAVKPINGS
jgi:putative peptidoglycan lipid II flippase